MLNWCEVTITDAKGQVAYKNAWVTTHQINDENVVEITIAGRTRWKIENENNTSTSSVHRNVLKNHGYHFEHNPSASSGHRFGHGKQHLSNLLATLILLSFLLHTVLDWVDVTYHTIRRLLPSRRAFFQDLTALLQYLPFDNWEHLMRFMLSGLDGENPD